MGVRTVRTGRRCAQLLVAALAACLSASAASAVQVSLPNNAVLAMVGDNTPPVPITIANTTGVNGVAVSFTYVSSIVTPTLVQGTTVTGGCLIQANTSTPGIVTISAACGSPLTPATNAVLFNVTFLAVANGVSPLTFTTAPLIPNGCLLNEGSPTCEPASGQISVGPMQPTPTATASRTATASATVTQTRTNTPVNTATITATNTVPPPATATVTNTHTIGPSPTVTQTHTVTLTATPSLTTTPSSTVTTTSTPQSTNTPTTTFTVTQTPTVTETRTPTATATATPIPTPRITSGTAGGSTRVFGSGAANLAAPGIEIVAENGEVLGTGGTNAAGVFTDGASGIGLSRELIPGERIFPRDVVNGLTGPVVIVGPRPPTQIPTLDQFGAGALGLLIAGALLWQLRAFARRASS